MWTSEFRPLRAWPVTCDVTYLKFPTTIRKPAILIFGTILPENTNFSPKKNRIFRKEHPLCLLDIFMYRISQSCFGLCISPLKNCDKMGIVVVIKWQRRLVLILLLVLTLSLAVQFKIGQSELIIIYIGTEVKILWVKFTRCVRSLPESENTLIWKI